MNKKELENEIIKTQEQLKKLQAALKEAEEDEVPNILSFEKGEKCYYMGTTGAIIEEESFDDNDYTNMTCALNRRFFKTRKYADIFSKKTQFIADMLHFKYLYDRDYEPNWDAKDELKFFVYYNTETKKFDWSFVSIYEYFESVYFSTRQLAKRCVEWLNKEHN